MYYRFEYCVITLIMVIHLAKCKETGVNLRSPVNQTQLAGSVQCPAWFFYNSSTRQCECYGDNTVYPGAVKCMKQKAYLKYNFYMTHSSERGLFLCYIFYYDASGFIKPANQPGFIELPSNISGLNDYMCGPSNRKGNLCSKCIDGFGPSATSPKFKCSNCTNAFGRYGIVIFLLSELVPVTIFYFIILVLQVNLTSSPMVSFIFHSQLVHNVINYHIVDPADQMKYFLSIASLFHGVWNLSFLRYVIPPFCISPNLQIIHIVYLQSISIVFPFLLIAITWICIKLYSCNCVVLVWLWRALTQLFLRHIKANRTVTVIDVFATFFLLSYAKLMFVLAIPMITAEVVHINDTTLVSNTIHKSTLDPSEQLLRRSHLIQVSVISILAYLTAVLPPVLLLALYPFRAFRSLLFKCCSSRCMASLAIFVEKFYNCYRDGLDGGRDMRSCASLPFIVVLLGFAMWAIGGNYNYYLLSAFCMFWSLSVVICQPYKKKYMAISDAVTLAITSILSIIIFNQSTSRYYQTALQVFGTIPMLWLVGFVIFKTKIKTSLNQIREKLLNCGNRNKEGSEAQHIQQIGNFSDISEADRILHPEQYINREYDSIS